jgi:hypothetical protein
VERGELRFVGCVVEFTENVVCVGGVRCEVCYSTPTSTFPRTDKQKTLIYISQQRNLAPPKSRLDLLLVV